MDLVAKAFSYIFLVIDSSIYTVVNDIYIVYMKLAGARIFQSELFIGIVDRIYAIIGVAMLFVLAYSIIQGIISPDKFSKGSSNGSQLIKKIVIAILGIALVPSVFGLAYRAQDAILENDIIGKIFLGYDKKSNVISYDEISVDGEPIVETGETNQNRAIKSDGGTVAALTMWQAFFYPADTEDPEVLDQIISESPPTQYVRGKAMVTRVACGAAIAAMFIPILNAIALPAAAVCGGAIIAGSAADKIVTSISGKSTSLRQAYGEAAASGEFSVFTAFNSNIAKGEVKFHGFLALVAGCVCLYLFISFALDMAVRAVKLAYLEIIAPIPLLLQVISKNGDDPFTNWYKECLKQFFQVFIRLSLVYVIVYLVAHIPTILEKSLGVTEEGSFTLVAALKICLILGLLMFAKEAPAFITKTLGIKGEFTGDMGLGIRDKLAKGGVFAAGAAVGGIGLSAANSLFGGASRIGQNIKRTWERDGLTDAQKTLRTFGSVAGGIFTLPLGMAVQTVSSSSHAVRNGREAKDIRGMVDAARRSLDQSKQDTAERNDWRNIFAGSGKSLKERWANFIQLPEVQRNKAAQDKIKLVDAMMQLKDSLNKSVETAAVVKAARRDLDNVSSDEHLQLLARRVAGFRGIDADSEAAQDEAKKIREQEILDKEKKLKEAQAKAISDSIAEGMAGGTSDALVALRQFLLNNHELLEQHGSMRMADGKTVAEFLNGMMGTDSLRGKPDGIAAMLHGAEGSVNVGLKDSSGHSGSIVLNRDKDGKISYKYIKSDGKSGVAKSFDEARAALGLDATGVKASTFTRGAMKTGTDSALRFLASEVMGGKGTKGISVNGTSYSLVNGASGLEIRDSSGTVLQTCARTDDVLSFFNGKSLDMSATPLTVTSGYLDQLSASKPGISPDWQLNLTGGTTIGYDAGVDSYYVVNGDNVEFKTRDELLTLYGSTTVEEEVRWASTTDSVATVSATAAKETRQAVLSSEDAIRGFIYGTSRNDSGKGGK